MDYPNVTEVREQARDDWEKRQRKRQSRVEKFTSLMDFWIVLIVLSFVALSIPHTVKVFDMITPMWGQGAFIGLEVGLLYRSFRGKVARIKNEPLPRSLQILAWLLFISLVVANGVGAFIAVADSQSVISGMSLSEIFQGWPDLPASAQIALVLVPLAAFMIPIGTIVGGEGLAALLLEARADGDPLDELWIEVAQDIEFVALRDAALNMKRTPAQARKWASSVVGLEQPRKVSGSDAVRTRRDSPKMRPSEAVMAYLDATGRDDLSVRQLADVVSSEIGVKVSKTTAGSVYNEWKDNRNGHSEEVL